MYFPEEHPTLNEEGNVTPVNLGDYSVSTTNGEVQIDNEEELLKSIKKALRAIYACTYSFKSKLGANMKRKSKRYYTYNFNFGDIVELTEEYSTR